MGADLARPALPQAPQSLNTHVILTTGVNIVNGMEGADRGGASNWRPTAAGPQPENQIEGTAEAQLHRALSGRQSMPDEMPGVSTFGDALDEALARIAARVRRRLLTPR